MSSYRASWDHRNLISDSTIVEKELILIATLPQLTYIRGGADGRMEF